jgi:hypothetical protein
MNEYPHVTELCRQETVGVTARKHLRLLATDHPYLVATSYIRQVLRGHDHTLMVGDTDRATRILLDFYSDQ